MSPERVLAAMESGPMISMANRQSAAARRAIAEFVTGKSFAHPMDTAPPAAAMCTTPAPEFGDPSSGPLWNGWGQNLMNTRFQTAAQAGLTAADLAKLKVKWAFGFPATLDANAHPAIANGRIFIGSTTGTVYSIDAAIGLHSLVLQCRGRRAHGHQRRRVSVPLPAAHYAAFFGDGQSLAYAVDAANGKLIWRDQGGDVSGRAHHRLADFL